MRTLYAVWSWVLFAAIVVQVGLAGYGAFYAAGKLDDEGSTIDEDVFFDGFAAHAHPRLSRHPRRPGLPDHRRSSPASADGGSACTALLFGLLVLQMILALFGFEAPVIGFFHPVNALLIFALSGLVAWRGVAVAQGGAPQDSRQPS